MKKYIGLLIVSIFAGLVFWSCGSDDSSTEPDPTTLTCEITSPLDTTGFFAGDTIRVTADANDDNASITEVRFLLDDTGFWSDEIYPYTAKISTNLLTVGTHNIKAVAENNNGKEVESSVFFGIKPKSPTNLNITQLNVYTFSLAWSDNSTGEDGFKIERKIDDGVYTQIAITTEKTYIDSTINKKGYSKVYYQVKAYKEIYNSNYVTNYATVGFPAPSGITYIKENFSTIKLSWNDNSSGEDGFKIDKNNGDADWVLGFASVSENIKTWTDNSAEINQNITYRVYAYKGANTSGTAQTSLINNSIPAPTNFSAPQTSITSSVLSWSDNSIGEDKFVIERKLSTETDYSILVEIPGSDTATKTWTDTTVPNLTYDYRVRTEFDTFYSAYALKTLNNLFRAPTNLTTTQTSITSADLTWTDNSLGEEKFVIERKLSTETTYVKVGEVTGSDTATKTYSDENIELNNIYDYQIKGVYGVNSSTNSSIRYENKLPAPSGLAASVESETSIKLDWLDNSYGEEGFKIDRKLGSDGAWVINFSVANANMKTFTDTGLSTGTTYYYRVRAYYSTTYSSYTSEVSGSPWDPSSFIPIVVGSFTMGSTTYSDEQPIHTVNITRAFYLGKYEITQQEWLTTMGSNPSYYTGNLSRPVEKVSWYSTLVYCNKRSMDEGFAPCYTISGSTDPANWGSVPTSTWNAVTCDFTAKGYRLPTEAEWEFAARYNDGRTYPWGETAPSRALCNYASNVGETTEVGSYPSGSSQLGLFDMAGNVYEWVWDWYATYLSTTETDPDGPDTAQSYRGRRGGAWFSDDIRCANRELGNPGFAGSYVGFRLARTK